MSIIDGCGKCKKERSRNFKDDLERWHKHGHPESWRYN